MSDSLQPHGLQHARLLCPPLLPRVCSNLCPLSWWCYLTTSSSAPSSPFAFNLSSIRVFSNELALHIRWLKYWSFSINPSYAYSGLISYGITGSPCGPRDYSRVFSSTTIQKHQFFDLHPTLNPQCLSPAVLGQSPPLVFLPLTPSVNFQSCSQRDPVLSQITSFFHLNSQRPPISSTEAMYLQKLLRHYINCFFIISLSSFTIRLPFDFLSSALATLASLLILRCPVSASGPLHLLFLLLDTLFQMSTQLILSPPLGVCLPVTFSLKPILTTLLTTCPWHSLHPVPSVFLPQYFHHTIYSVYVMGLFSPSLS